MEECIDYLSTYYFPPTVVLHRTPAHVAYYGDPVKACICSPGIVTKYQKRISGPLLDRIDIHIEVPRVEYEKLSDVRLGEPSNVIQKRVEAARQRQRERFDESWNPKISIQYYLFYGYSSGT